MGKIKVLLLTDTQRLALEEGSTTVTLIVFVCVVVPYSWNRKVFQAKRFGSKRRCHIYQSIHGRIVSNNMGLPDCIPVRDVVATYHGLIGRSCGSQGYRRGQAKREQSQGKLAECNRGRSERLDLQTFFISIGARYKRIRKRPRRIPSPQLYEYKTEKL